MQSVNAILAFTLQIYDQKIFPDFFLKPLDKPERVCYNI